MSATWIERLGSGFQLEPPATAAAIARLETELGVKLPADYVEFLRAADGAYVQLPNAFAHLYSAEMAMRPTFLDLRREFWPECVGFGSDGGGEMLAFDTRRTPWRVVVVPCIGDGVADAVDRAPSFRAFLEALARGESIFPAGFGEGADDAGRGHVS